MQPPYAGGGYPIPPRPGSSGSSTLVIVIVVVVGLLVLGAGACAAGAFVLFGVTAAPGAHGKPSPVSTAEPTVTEDPEDPEDPEPPAPVPPAPPAKPVGPPKKGPRTVDFVCPPGKPPAGTVRAGCMCGSEILGSACGASGFSDVVATAKGCRFTCE